MLQTTKFETGATTHAVNDLILFADNTRELVATRDEIYQMQMNGFTLLNISDHFQRLYVQATKQYKREFPDTDSRYFLPLGSDMAVEFCNLYAADFDTWKQEHGF